MEYTSCIVSAITAELSYELEEMEQTNSHYCLARAAFGGNLGSDERSPPIISIAHVSAIYCS